MSSVMLKSLRREILNKHDMVSALVVLLHERLLDVSVISTHEFPGKEAARVSGEIDIAAMTLMPTNIETARNCFFVWLWTRREGEYDFAVMVFRVSVTKYLR